MTGCLFVLLALNLERALRRLLSDNLTKCCCFVLFWSLPYWAICLSWNGSSENFMGFWQAGGDQIATRVMWPCRPRHVTRLHVFSQESCLIKEPESLERQLIKSLQVPCLLSYKANGWRWTFCGVKSNSGCSGRIKFTTSSSVLRI